MGLETHFYRGNSKRKLQKEIENVRTVQKKRVVFVLDEAHLLGKETLEEFRFLLNYRFDSTSPMSLARQDLFTSGAEDEIFKVSAGIPRMINRICEKTLMYAYQQQKRLIDEYMVRFVADHEMVSGIE